MLCDICIQIYKKLMSNVRRPNLTSESLAQGLGHAYRGRTFMLCRSNIWRLPFLPPTMTHMGTSSLGTNLLT